MPDTKKPLQTGISATIAFWLAAAFLNSMTGNVAIIQAVAGLIAFTATLAIWIILAWDQLPVRSVSDTTEQKMKRPDAYPRDDRLALLVALLSEHERQALQARLVDELDSDGEIRLADLLVEEESVADYVGRSIMRPGKSQ